MPPPPTACRPPHRRGPVCPPPQPKHPTRRFPKRSHRRPMAPAGAPASPAALWPRPARSPGQLPTRAGGRHLVCALDRLPVAGAASLLPALAHRPSPLRPLDRRRHPGPPACRAARPDANGRRCRSKGAEQGLRPAGQSTARHSNVLSKRYAASACSLETKMASISAGQGWCGGTCQYLNPDLTRINNRGLTAMRLCVIAGRRRPQGRSNALLEGRPEKPVTKRTALIWRVLAVGIRSPSN
jgi:hypothetical protein